MYFEQREMNMMNPIPEEFRTLFLGDLSIHCTRQDVLQLFQPYGCIERITLKVGASMKGLGYGFISFSDRESAERAMNWLQSTILLGRALRISWATPRGQTHLVNKETPKVVQQTAEVHFSFLTKQTHFTVTEAIIRKQYEKFGDITDVVIKRTKINPKLAYQNGYGFVRYALTSEGIQAAIDATKYMHQVQIDGINYDTHLTHALETLLERISPEILREHQISSRHRGPMMTMSGGDDYSMPMMVDYAPPVAPYEPSHRRGSNILNLDRPPRGYQQTQHAQRYPPQQSASYYAAPPAEKMSFSTYGSSYSSPSTFQVQQAHPPRIVMSTAASSTSFAPQGSSSAESYYSSNSSGNTSMTTTYSTYSEPSALADDFLFYPPHQNHAAVTATPASAYEEAMMVMMKQQQQEQQQELQQYQQPIQSMM